MVRSFGLATALLALTVVAMPAGPAHAQAVATEPGGDKPSADLAQSDPDEYAWRLFLFINLQAAAGKAGVPAGRAITDFDEDTPTVWESWALASGNGDSQEGSEVYKSDGSDPGTWEQLPRVAPAEKLFSVGLKIAAGLGEDLGLPAPQHTRPRLAPTGALNPNLLVGPGNPTGDFEVRMNRAAFEFVQQNTLYNIEGLVAKFTAAKATGNRDLVQFPAAAKEVKAVWVPATNPTAISVDEKARYHWRKVGNRFYKLAGFHVTTKDLKQWFWSDFAHEDFETTPPPALASLDGTTRGPAAQHRGTKDGERRELVGSKWAHYRLRGAQIDFLDANGRATVVGNTLIERGRADKSSCITCHFSASMAEVRPNGFLDTLPAGNFVVGKPNATALGPGDSIRYLQNDFVWSAPFRAQHKTAN